MRLSIESRNRWTIDRIVSSKHDKLDRKSAHTFVSNTSIKDNADRSEDTSLSFSRDTTNSFRTFDTSVHRYAQLPRRKSIHGQIGRFFLRISRMYSDTQYDAYAYQYGHGASELPAGGPPIEGSTSFQEMPGSFPPDGIFELEDVQRQDIQCCSKTGPYTGHELATTSASGSPKITALCTEIDVGSLLGDTITNFSHYTGAKHKRRSKSKSRLAEVSGHDIALHEPQASTHLCSLWILGTIHTASSGNAFNHQFLWPLKQHNTTVSSPIVWSFFFSCMDAGTRWPTTADILAGLLACELRPKHG
ncbi:hypothetical protein ST47_g7092 [Ascochyta rabiei]|uniref:Uncharacterized protein n=1 Tax=Didymella rabiei TaxID=5454 RepID=A0A163BF33_DIDRA|nr:hypothetical protein ST47_g7092 [Ascochyta rabiei]